MGSYKKIGLSHEIGLIDTPPFFETLHPFIYCPYEVTQGNSEFFDFSIKSYFINYYHFSPLFYDILTQEVTMKVQQPLLIL